MDHIAAIIAIIAAFAFALAATLWQRAAMNEGVEPGDSAGMVKLLANPVWLLGLGAQAIGVVLQGAALDRGRVAIIQPLLVTSIVWALPLGYYVTKQRITQRHVLGAVVIVAGLAAFATFGDPAGGVDDAPVSDWIVALLILAVICVVCMVFGSRGPLGREAALVGATAGILYGVSATLMKPVVESWHTNGLGATLGDWEIWTMISAGLLGFYLQQVSLATGKLVTSVATVSVINPVVSVALGAFVLQERLSSDPEWHLISAIGALAVALVGATIIASASDPGSQAAEPSPVSGSGQAHPRLDAV